MSEIIRIGSRRSRLAMWQSEHVGQLLQKRTGRPYTIIQVVTSGDRIIDRPLPEIGAKGLFTKELEDMLLDDAIDMAVHSLKDLPSDLPEGLTLGAISQREDPRDAFISSAGVSFTELPAGARIGTGSVRRSAQLLHQRNDIEIAQIRGNVPTRIDKLDAGAYDAILLAAAGVKRLGLDGRITECFPTGVMVPAPGQGALGVECRASDDEIGPLLAEHFADPFATVCCRAERVVGARLNAGCNAPVGVHAHIAQEQIVIEAFVSDLGGKQFLRATESGPRDDYRRVADDVADGLIADGGAELIRSVRDAS